MISFSKIKWKNFLSTGNSFIEIDLLSYKSTLIIGDNGAGKSTLLDALAFVLYGTAFRNIRKPQLLNSVNQKNLVVEVEFSNGHSEFLIRRGMKPNIFEIFQNEKLINQTAASRDYQQYLEKDILKMNFKSFSQIVVLGSATFVPFMQLVPASRREIINDLLDMQIFSVMHILLKDRNSQNKEHFKQNEYKTDLTTEKLKLQQKYKETLLQNNQDLVHRKQTQITEYELLIETSSKEKEELSTELTVLLEKSNVYESSVVKKTEYESVLDKLHRNLDKLRKEDDFYLKTDACPTCQQTIDPLFKETKRAKIIEKSQEMVQVVPKLDEKVKNLQTTIEMYKNVIDQIKVLRTNIISKDSNILHYQSFIAQLRAEMSELSEKNENVQELTDNILILKNDLKHLTQEKKDIIEEQKLFKIALEMLKDTGIKSLIIKQYVPIINKLVNHYLQLFDFFVQFELDENFNEKIKSRFRDEFSYASFSEGEKKRIDLALMLTWRSIAKLRNSVNTNLLIMDEVFDGSMDGDGVDNLINMIRTVCKDDNLFIISHNRSAMLDKFERVISFKKQGNFSKMTVN
jgi:DNA repair exonuclease SbcCD ATPase subunit